MSQARQIYHDLFLCMDPEASTEYSGQRLDFWALTVAGTVSIESGVSEGLENGAPRLHVDSEAHALLDQQQRSDYHGFERFVTGSDIGGLRMLMYSRKKP